MTHTSVLYRLQVIDSEADTKRSRLDEIKVLVGQNDEVAAAGQTLEDIQKQVKAAKAHIASIELDVGSLEQKANTAESRLYSGAVTNPKELQDLEQELVSLGGRRETLDDALLEGMLLLEGHQNEEAKATSRLDSVEASWAKSQSDLLGEREQLEARLQELVSERDDMVSQIANDAMAVYDKLRAQLGGVVIATIKDGVCSACGVAPTSSIRQQASHGQLDARCATCERILTGG